MHCEYILETREFLDQTEIISGLIWHHRKNAILRTWFMFSPLWLTSLWAWAYITLQQQESRYNFQVIYLYTTSFTETSSVHSTCIPYVQYVCKNCKTAPSHHYGRTNFVCVAGLAKQHNCTCCPTRGPQCFARQFSPIL